MRNILSFLAVVSILFISLVTLLLTCTREGRASVKTLLFISEVVPDFPLKPLSWTTANSIQERIEFLAGEDMVIADIFRPVEQKPTGAILIFLGVAPAGPEDSRVIRMGEALAKNNIVAMFYWSPTMFEKTLEVNDIDNLIEAFKYLYSLDYVDKDRVGMAGFCVGASFALIAASDENIRDKVDFIHAFGPYFDMTKLVGDIASSSQSSEDSRLPWKVDPLTYEIFVKALTKHLGSKEAMYLQTYFIEGKTETVFPMSMLSAEGHTIYQLLKGVPAQTVDQHINKLPETLLNQFDQLSPRLYIKDLQAPVHLMHDREDPLIPSAHSRQLARSLNPNTTRYTEFLMFQHMDPDRKLNPLILATELTKFFIHLQPVFSRVS